MILPAQDIRRQQLVHPLEESTLHEETGTTYGLSACGYDVRLDQDVVLQPGGFELASTIERFATPSSLCGIVHDKSTWARLGLAVQNTVIEPGWDGYLTLEITNHSRNGFVLQRGTPIAQIIWHLLTEETELPYSGKYQNQAQGVQPPIGNNLSDYS